MSRKKKAVVTDEVKQEVLKEIRNEDSSYHISNYHNDRERAISLTHLTLQYFKEHQFMTRALLIERLQTDIEYCQASEDDLEVRNPNKDNEIMNEALAIFKALRLKLQGWKYRLEHLSSNMDPWEALLKLSNLVEIHLKSSGTF